MSDLPKDMDANKTTPNTAAGTNASIVPRAESSHHYWSSHVWYWPNIYLQLLAQILYKYVYTHIHIYVYIGYMMYNNLGLQLE